MFEISHIIAMCIVLPYILGGFYLVNMTTHKAHCDSAYYFTTNFTTTEAPDELQTTTKKPDGGEGEGNPPPPPPRARRDNRFCAGGDHGVYSLLGTLIVGLSIICFRVLIDIKTRFVKYLHMMFHFASLVLFILGLWYIFIHEYELLYNPKNIHSIVAWIVFVFYCLQFLIAFLIHIYQVEWQELRYAINPYHDIFGVWLYLCLVGCSISGRSLQQIDYVGYSFEKFLALGYFCFVLILVVMLSPFFEWEIIGLI